MYALLRGRASATLVAISPTGDVDRLALSPLTAPTRLAVTRNGDLLTWPALSVQPLIRTGIWGYSSALPATTAAATLRLLGQPLTPTDRCAGRRCQVFVKGALMALPGQQTALVPLVRDLIGARSNLPVGASISSVTYKTLYGIHNRRTPLPPGFQHGTMPVRGGTFIPYSPTLAPASGYIVPSYFWHYMADSRNAPSGWLHDIGLPLTPAVPATVTKGKLGTRRIMLQAFQDAVLTYEPKNPAPFRVERANVGVDYATTFPQDVR